MALSEIDRKLLNRCLSRKPHAWEDFVDRFLGLVVHVVHHTVASRSISLDKQDEEDLVADVLLAIVEDDLAVLRRFRGESSLATYLTVISRRVAVRELLKKKAPRRTSNRRLSTYPTSDPAGNPRQNSGSATAKKLNV